MNILIHPKICITGCSIQARGSCSVDYSTITLFALYAVCDVGELHTTSARRAPQATNTGGGMISCLVIWTHTFAFAPNREYNTKYRSLLLIMSAHTAHTSLLHHYHNSHVLFSMSLQSRWAVLLGWSHIGEENVSHGLALGTLVPWVPAIYEAPPPYSGLNNPQKSY